MTDGKIKVLVVDDSKVSRELMSHLLSLDTHFIVVGTAEDGVEALDFIAHHEVDVVFTDIVMPKMNGFELTKKIMEIKPLPVIVVSGVYNREEIAKSFAAIDAGALSILEKPKGIEDSKFVETARFLVDVLKAMSTVRYSDKLFQRKEQEKSLPDSNLVLDRIRDRKKHHQAIEAVAIGSSLGGPKLLKTLLGNLPENVKAPIFIVQHIFPGFVQGFVDWLGENTKLKVELGKEGLRVLPGHVYVAPDGGHMVVNASGMLSIVKDSASTYVPSIARLFESILPVYGPNSLVILFAGAEKDGTKELVALHAKGALTIAERPLHKSATQTPFSEDEYGSLSDISKALELIVPEQVESRF